MADWFEQRPESTSGSIRRIEWVNGFRQAPMVATGVGFAVTLLSTFLPYASVSISVFGGNLGAYEGSSPSPWFVSVPIGLIALLLAVAALVCVLVIEFSDQSPGTDHVLAAGITGAGLFVIIVTFFELFWVSSRVKDIAGFLSDAINISPATGYLGLMVGGAILTLGGAAALVHANAKSVANSNS